ncbi:helix-turn-helix domain-containing protein [Saccharothrix sp. NPDC042600]|uniref:winged helix-turn-helix transcriptional regulator n=1 Tax=Saccharothrix TaxID=2071 RepID=UPI0033D9E904|nr:helix-turn-helix domain-containing protein [Saccharothrix mutabilis subsp. capreolus]
MAMTLDGPLADRDRWRATRCSIGKAMDAIGNRTAVLLLREAFYGTTRFHDFATRVGVTEASAAARLRELVELGVFEKRPYQEPGQRTRHEYVLTEMGRDLLPIVMALMQWGDRHLQGDDAPLRVVDTTGSPVRVRVRNDRGDDLSAEDLVVRVNR